MASHIKPAPPRRNDSATHRRNDPGQYDQLASQWWSERGRFAMLQWIADARADLIPRPGEPGALLVDVACGAGLIAPRVQALGYRHVGFDITRSALTQARDHGVVVAQADARHLPLPDASADVVVAGECLEHIPPMPVLVAEICRVLRPGGTLVLDTIAAGRWAALVAVTIAERLPGGPPPLLHDPALFIDRDDLVGECRRHGVDLRLHGLRPAVGASLAWLLHLRTRSRMVRSRSTRVLFAGMGTRMMTPESTTTEDPQP